MMARRIMVAVGTTALLASGVYVFVYLYRWEWHRAVFAGIVFVAAEVGLGIAALLDRLQRLERRLDQTPSEDDMRRLLGHIEDAAPARRPFQWLGNEVDRLGVFVPILLGAGVVLSALAWAVERLARATAGPILERGLALRLAPLAFPEGGLTGAPAPLRPALPARRLPLRSVAVTILAGVTVAFAVDFLADVTQDRPDGAPAAGTVSVVTLTVDSKTLHNDGGSVEVARTVWSACTSQLRRHGIPDMVDVGRGRVEAIVSPALGAHARDRLRGCLGDATVDRLDVNVADIQTLEP